MRTPCLLLDVDGVLIPFPADDGSTPASHVRHDVVPAGRRADDPVAVWLNPEHGPLLMDVFRNGLVNPVWCTSWRRDAATLIGPLLGLPPLPYVDLFTATDHDQPSRWLPLETRLRRHLAGRRTRHLDRRRLHQP